MVRTKILDLGKRGLLAIVLSLITFHCIFSQTKSSVHLLEFKYCFQTPAGDLQSRFGGNNAVGASFQSVGYSKNIFFGVEGNFIFGSKVKEDVLENLRTYDGSIIGIDGQPGDVSLKERGFYVGVNTGKIFKTTKIENNLTGIRAQIGLGLLQHKIRVQDNASTIVALSDQYIKGYDRLTNGAALHLALGFQYDSPKNNFHFNIMGDLFGASTLSRRDFDNMTGDYLDENRNDILGGISVSYIVSISRTDKADQIYY